MCNTCRLQKRAPRQRQNAAALKPQLLGRRRSRNRSSYPAVKKKRTSQAQMMTAVVLILRECCMAGLVLTPKKKSFWSSSKARPTLTHACITASTAVKFYNLEWNCNRLPTVLPAMVSVTCELIQNSLKLCDPDHFFRKAKWLPHSCLMQQKPQLSVTAEHAIRQHVILLCGQPNGILPECLDSVTFCYADYSFRKAKRRPHSRIIQQKPELLHSCIIAEGAIK